MSDDSPTPESTESTESTLYERSSGQKATFWLLWILLLLPAIGVSLLAVNAPLLFLLALIQFAIHYVAWQRFHDAQQPFSKTLLVLLGGTGVMYFVLLGGCVILLVSLSGSNFH